MGVGLIRSPLDLDATLPFGTLSRDGAIVGCWWSQPDPSGGWPRSPVSADEDPGQGRRPALRAFGIWRTPTGAPSASKPCGVAATALAALFEALAAEHGPHPDTDVAFGDVMLAAHDMTEFGRGRVSYGSVIQGILGHASMPDETEEVWSKRFRAVDAFVSTLDGCAIRLAGQLDTLDAWEVDAYRLLDRTFTPDAPLAVAMSAHPEFPYLCVRACRADPDGFGAAVRGGRLGGFLMDVTGLPRHLARLLPRAAAALDAYDPIRVATMVHGHVGMDPPEALVRYLEGLPPSWAPRDVEAWHAMADCVPALAWARAFPREAYATVVDVQGDWVMFRDRLMAGIAVPPRAPGELGVGDRAGERAEALAVALDGVLDAAVALCRQVVAPAAALADRLAHDVSVRQLLPARDGRDQGEPVDPDEEAHVGLLLFAGERSLAGTLRASARWHAGRSRIDDAIVALPGDVAAATSWPAAFPDHHERDHKGQEWRLMVLTDVAALVDEGSAGRDAAGDHGLDHCVAGYAEDCRSGRCRIASVRKLVEGRWQRAYTAEIVLDEDRLPRVRQLTGHRNGRPSLGAAGFLTGYVAGARMALMAPGRHARMLEGLAPLPLAGSLSARAGYEWWRTGHWGKAMLAWSPLLPGRLRAMSAADVAALCTDGHGRLRVPGRVDPEDVFPSAPA